MKQMLNDLISWLPFLGYLTGLWAVMYFGKFAWIGLPIWAIINTLTRKKRHDLS